MQDRTIRFAGRFLLAICLPSLMTSTRAYAVNSSPQGVIKHVIIVIQENRTPDNLFYSDSNLVANGADVQPPNSQGFCGNTPIPLSTVQIDTCYDPRHLHQDWLAMFHGGDMKGACDIDVNTKGCINPPPACPVGGHKQYCPEYSYVDNPEWDPVHHYTLLQPYFQIAEHYGFANRMFQSNQGPSHPAHQFLLSGTSAPVPYTQGGTEHQWFAAENPTNTSLSGCIAPADEYVKAIDEGGGEPTDTQCKNNPPDARCLYPCYDHPTLVNVLNTAGVSWRYYAQKAAHMWSAPTAMNAICVPNPTTHGLACTGADWINGLASVLPTVNPVEQAPILRDIERCNLPAVSWVIPDGHWSDHAGTVGHDGGPSWVAAIVNAIGNSWEQSKVNGQNHMCDYWGGHTNSTANQPAVVLVTWDDWGGWYDHVPPFSIGYPGGNGNGQYYTYSFRVPLLVVSAFTKQVTPQGGYISGAVQNPTCPNTYCHDFGSLLNFIEYTFGTGGHPLGQIGDDNYPYADHFAPDGPFECSNCLYSLSDFFGDFDQPHGFTAITGAKYPEQCFHQPDQTGCFPSFSPADPDNDADEID